MFPKKNLLNNMVINFQSLNFSYIHKRSRKTAYIRYVTLHFKVISKRSQYKVYFLNTV